MLDAVVDYLPSPVEVPSVTGVNPTNPEESLSREPKNDEPLAALVFKVAMDDGRRVAFMRIFSGTLNSGEDVLNARTGKKERVARLFEVHANKRQRIEKAVAGMIVTATGLKVATTGDTLCSSTDPILLERIDTYEPVISIAIEPETNAEKERLDFALAKTVDEDPTFRVREDEDTGQTIISGMGELHLDIIVGRLTRDYKVKARVGKPQVVYRETVSKSKTASSTFQRSLNETELFAEATCSVKPRERGEGSAFACAVSGEPPVPEEYVEAAMQGLKDAAHAGPGGFPLDDVEVTLTKIGFREDAQPEVSLRAAAADACRRAVSDASPLRLEPIMRVEITSPEEHVGSIIGDLNSRRGHIQNVGQRGQKSVVEALVPLSNMFGYSTEIRSLSSGRAQFAMTFERNDALE